MLCGEWIDEADANNEDLPCEGFIPDDNNSDDDATTQS